MFNEDLALHQTSMPGILWIAKCPDLTCVLHLQFEMCTVIHNFELAHKIYCDIQKKFAAIMPEHFSDQTMAKWSEWMVSQQKIWDPNFHSENPISYSALTLPSSYQRRATQVPCVGKSRIQHSRTYAGGPWYDNTPPRGPAQTEPECVRAARRDHP